MKKHWLRGVLLGVSMALLLTGGIALAQSLTVEPECFQCWPGTEDDWEKLQPGNPYSYIWDSCGWEPGTELMYTEQFLATGWLVPPTENPTADENGCVSCDGRGWFCEVAAGDHRSGSLSAAVDGQFPDDFWGPFEVCLRSVAPADASANAMVCETILFAEVCEAEFVPEPGSIILLGSGLLGLAGYAGLRWRTRE